MVKKFLAGLVVAALVVLSAACPASVWRGFEERFGGRIIDGFGLGGAAGLVARAEANLAELATRLGNTQCVDFLAASAAIRSSISATSSRPSSISPSSFWMALSCSFR